jgi:O-antigen ligase
MNNPSGQLSLQLVIPLSIILLLAFVTAYFMPVISAGKALTIAAGIILFALSFASSQAALYILIFSMLLGPEAVVGSTDAATLGRGITLRLDDFILMIISVGWLARMAIHKELGLFLKTPLNRPIAFYIIVTLISTLVGCLMGRVHIITGTFFVLKYFQYVIIYFMVVNNVQDEKQIHYFLRALLFTCVAVSIFGVLQIPGGGRVSAPFEGEIGEPNTLGGYLVFMMALSTGLLFAAQVWREKLIYAGISVIAFIPFLYTQSRASYLSFFPMLFTFVWLSEKRKVIVLWLLFLLAFLPLVAPQTVKDRITYTFRQSPQRGQVQIGEIRLDTSTSVRLRSWSDALEDMVRHPIVGFGVTGYHFVDAQYPRVLVETGIVGMFSFILLMVAIFKQGIASFRKSEGSVHKGLSMGFLAGFMGLLVHAIGANTFIIVRIMEPFWFVLAMVVMAPELQPGDPAKEGQ